MAKTLVLAEKPSVGRDLTRVLPGQFAKHEGYLESDSHIVTWAVGHLVQLAEPDEYDMSGLSFAGTGPDFAAIKVRRVSAGSPAADAGIKRDDVLERVDGRPVAELGLSGVRELLRRDGAEVELEVRTGSTLRTVKVRLRRRI